MQYSQSKKAYKQICASNTQGRWPGQGRIWKLKVQQRVRTFTWLLAHGKLLANFNRWKRMLTESLDCEICHEQEETNLHAIRDCNEARKVWSQFIPPNLQQQFYLLPFQYWVLWNLSSGRLHKLSHEYKIRFAIVCQWVQKWRNEATFNEACMGEHLKAEHIKEVWKRQLQRITS